MRLIDAQRLTAELTDLIGIVPDSDLDLFLTYIKLQPTVDAVPVSFIKSESKRMELEVDIAMSEDDDETAERWITRLTALIALIGQWKVKVEE